MANTSLSDNERRIDRWLQGRGFADWRAEFDANGYVVFDDVLRASEVDGIRVAMMPFLEQNITGRNDFEGLKSNRVYALVSRSPVFADLVAHPLALAFAEADLGRSCLLSACLAINLQPGETVQPWHHDDAHIEVPRPRPSWGVSAFWSIDETTDSNGATELLPGSHLWPETDIEGASKPADFSNTDVRKVHHDPGARPDVLKVLMKPGSLLLAKGTLWHRGGANRSDRARLVITPQYCPGWARQLENIMATMSLKEAAALPERTRELIGYSIHAPFMGYVDGVHPKRLLER